MAINPGMRLKSYLEGMGDLTLSWLRRILRSHYQEKSATQLYQKVTGATGESTKLLIRALDSRQKIPFAPK